MILLHRSNPSIRHPRQRRRDSGCSGAVHHQTCRLPAATSRALANLSHNRCYGEHNNQALYLPLPQIGFILR